MCWIFYFPTQCHWLTVLPVVSLVLLVAVLRSLPVLLRTLNDVPRCWFRSRILILYVMVILQTRIWRTNLFPSQTTNHWQSKSSFVAVDAACLIGSAFESVKHHVCHYSRYCCYSTGPVSISDRRPWLKLRLWTRHPLWRLVYLVITKHWARGCHGAHTYSCLNKL